MTVEVAEYDPVGGLRDLWVDGYEVEVAFELGEVVIFGNAAGLRSLAGHLLALSQDAVPPGSSLHFSQSYGLTEGSTELVLGKKMESNEEK